MIESIIYNVAVMVAGIYLFHRLQYSENKIMVFSKGYVTVLMTIVALLLAAYPIPFHQEYLVHLTFVPLLFLGRFTNMGYTLVSAVIVALVEVFAFGNSLLWCRTYSNRYHCKYGWTFLKQNDIVALVVLNLISVIILLILSIFSPLYDLTEIAFLVPISFVLTIASAITFVDMWHFFSLVTRYENEDKFDYLTD